MGEELQAAGVFQKPGDPRVVGRLIAYMNTVEFFRKDFIDG